MELPEEEPISDDVEVQGLRVSCLCWGMEISPPIEVTRQIQRFCLHGPPKRMVVQPLQVLAYEAALLADVVVPDHLGENARQALIPLPDTHYQNGGDDDGDDDDDSECSQSRQPNAKRRKTASTVLLMGVTPKMRDYFGRYRQRCSCKQCFDEANLDQYGIVGDFSLMSSEELDLMMEPMRVYVLGNDLASRVPLRLMAPSTHLPRMGNINNRNDLKDLRYYGGFLLLSSTERYQDWSKGMRREGDDDTRYEVTEIDTMPPSKLEIWAFHKLATLIGLDNIPREPKLLLSWRIKDKRTYVVDWNAIL